MNSIMPERVTANHKVKPKIADIDAYLAISCSSLRGHCASFRQDQSSIILLWLMPDYFTRLAILLVMLGHPVGSVLYLSQLTSNGVGMTV